MARWPGQPLPVDPELKKWATPRQATVIDLINEHGSEAKAAAILGVHKSAPHAAVRAVKKKAALYGYSPEHNMTHTAPEPFVVKGVSTYHGRDGEVRGQWVKTTLDDQKREEMQRAAAEAMSAEMPRLDPIEGPAQSAAELCNLFTFTDCHVGMLAWDKEAGEDWDLRIAERTLVGCFEQLILATPKARVAVINQLGDFLHTDGLSAVTPTHGHLLDADGRFSKMIAVAIRILRRIIDIALMRHDEVHLIIAEGNHDPASAVWLRHMFAALYENEARLRVNESELPYYVYQHGKTMLGFHHGHLRKNDQLPILFAAQYSEIWGQTTRRYIHTGHRHHVEEKEHSGVTVIQHPTLAARDAYAARGGWIADRAATAITYHSQYGQVGRNSVSPEMLR